MWFKKLPIVFLAVLLFVTSAVGQGIQFDPGQIFGNSTSSPRPGRAESLAAIAARAGLGATSPQVRITLTSGTPVMGSSVAASTNVYVTPTGGNVVPIYNGTNFIPTAFAEVVQTTTDTTKSPTAVAASKVYDIFCWVDSAVNRCTRGPAWSSGIARGYTFTSINGILLNTSAITNGPAALRGTYVGTIASNAGSTIDFIFGTASTGGIAGVFNVWNAYNRVDVGCLVIDTGTAYTYNSNVPRQVRGNPGMQVSFVVGLAEDKVFSSYAAQVQTVAVNAATVSWGLGFDSITAYSQRATFINQNGTTTWGSALPAVAVWNPGIGSHFVAALEASDASGNANNLNIAGAATINGLSFGLRM